MADRSERAVLNRLIETCRDAEHGFRAAAEHVTHRPLQQMLLDMADQRAAFVRELLPYAQRLGGARDHDGTAAAAVHRTWMNVRHAMAGTDVPVVKEVERGEQHARDAYRGAIDGLLPPTVREVVETQYAELQELGKRLEPFDHQVRTL